MSERYINISIFAIKAITNECSIYAIPFMYIICDTKINRFAVLLLGQYMLAEFGLA